MNYEVVKGSPFNRSSKEKPKEGTIFKQSAITISPSHEEFYLSMFGFDNSIDEWMSVHHTVAGFNGFYFCNYLYFDVDNEDVTKSLEFTRELVTRLYAQLGINPKQLYLSFSGSKGFHVGLHANLFGGFESSRELPDQIKALAVLVAGACYEMTLAQVDKDYNANNPKTFRGLDLSIYNKNRIFRVINSKNDKSGLYKVGLTSQELLSLSIEEIKALARAPRTSFALETKVSQLSQNENLSLLWTNAKRFNPENYQKETKKEKSKIKGSFFRPPAEGSRNEELFAQACMIFDHSDFNEESVRQIISSINQASEQPLEQEELNKLVKSAFSRTSPNQKYKGKKEVEQVETFNTWFDEWVDYYTSEVKPLTCVFTAIDEDNENNYRGKLACLIGKGGSRKSYFAQNVISQNIMVHNARVIYSSMEMGKVEVVNRLLDIFCDPINGKPASKHLRAIAKSDKDKVRSCMKDEFSHIDQRLILSNSASMTVEDYEKLIQKTIAIFGDLDILVVDGLSAMGGKGNETEIYSHNTLLLKELAKKYNLFVILVCHVTKEAKEYNRDPKNFVRGSEKILDNSDFFISFSQLIDQYHSTPDNISYEKYHGHIKYYNKRGTGLSLNEVYEFSGVTKRVSSTHMQPTDFITYEELLTKHARKSKSKGNEPF